MAYPTIVFNASTGSDTAASGAGPSTAVTGTGASLNATTAVDLSADSPDLSGVATDGTACLWVQTSSGRQFSKITAVDNSTKIVTVETAYSVTESSRTWAIGGKRATWDNSNSRRLFADYLALWTIETETDQTITSALVPSASLAGPDYVTVRGSTAHKIITQSGSGAALFAPTGDYIKWQDLHFKHSHATNEYAVVVNAALLRLTFVNCICGDAASGSNPKGFLRRGTGGTAGSFVNCEARYCTEDGFGQESMRGLISAVGCYAHHCGRHGFATRGDGGMQVVSCIASDNGGSGFFVNSSVNGQGLVLVCNVAHQNGSHGMQFQGIAITANVILNNNLTANGTGGTGYGIFLNQARQNIGSMVIDHNNYGTGATANATGTVFDSTAGPNDLEVDPEYTDAANGDYSIGTNLKAKGFPKFDEPIGINSSTYSYVDIGAAQRQESAAGGGVRIPNIRGGADQ